MTTGNQFGNCLVLFVSRKTEDSDCSERNNELPSLQEAKDDYDLGETGQICMWQQLEFITATMVIVTHYPDVFTWLLLCCQRADMDRLQTYIRANVEAEKKIEFLT